MVSGRMRRCSLCLCARSRSVGIIALAAAIKSAAVGAELIPKIPPFKAILSETFSSPPQYPGLYELMKFRAIFTHIDSSAGDKRDYQ